MNPNINVSIDMEIISEHNDIVTVAILYKLPYIEWNILHVFAGKIKDVENELERMTYKFTK